MFQIKPDDLSMILVICHFECRHISIFLAYCAVCEKCQKIGHTETPCVEIECPSSMTRCLRLDYTESHLNGETHHNWKKTCSSEPVCDYSTDNVCKLADFLLAKRPGNFYSNCKVTCSGWAIISDIKVLVITLILALFYAQR